jgi:two-component system invasion response regulator UvrY
MTLEKPDLPRPEKNCRRGGRLPVQDTAASRILLVDDHAPTREEMATLLAGRDGLQVIAQADSGEDAIQKARLLKPDLVVMDIFLPGISGVEATAAITRELPGVRVVALSNHCGSSVVKAFLRAGGMGYVRKSSAFEELVPAIEAALAGQSYMGPEVSD